VLADVGYCVCVRDVLDVGVGRVHPLDGGATYDCGFTLLVFRPSPNHLLEGRIIASDARGVTVSLGFFSQVFVPTEKMPAERSYDATSKIWSWTPESEASELHFDIDATVRFRVAEVNFTAVSKQKKGVTVATTTSSLPKADDAARVRSSSVDLSPSDPPPSAMVVVGSFDEDGLGVVGWWVDDDQ